MENIDKAQEPKEENVDVIKENEETKLPVLYKEDKWYEKIKTKIIEFFRKIFNRNREEEGINE